MTYPSSQAGEHAEHALATCIASMARSLAMVVRNSPNEEEFKTEAVELVQKIQQTIQISESENDSSSAPPYSSMLANETKDGHDVIDVLAQSMHRVARSMSLKAPKSNEPARSTGPNPAKVGDAAEDEILEVSDDEILEVSDDEVVDANVSWSDVMDVDILGSDE